jgi:hypothetical protein
MGDSNAAATITEISADRRACRCGFVVVPTLVPSVIGGRGTGEQPLVAPVPRSLPP